MRPRASIIVPTRNRKDDLRKALASVFTQSVPVEAIVCDDGSTDGTYEMVRSEFPQVKIRRNEQSVGSCFNRNRATEMAEADIVVSIDDDCVLTSARTIEQTLAEFDDERIACIGMPYVNVRDGPAVLQRAPGESGVFVHHSFRGCAAAWRKSLYHMVGGQSEVIGHIGEEPELCAKFWGAGYYCKVGRADPIEHHESPKRDMKRLVRLYARFPIIIGWINAPLPDVLWYLPGASVRCLVTAVKRREFLAGLDGVLEGYGRVLRFLSSRRPVPASAWRIFRRLRHVESAPLESVINDMPPMVRPT